jgi:hypothetical protein
MNPGCLSRLLLYMLLVALLILRPINNIAQTFAHPQSIARQVVTEVEVSLGDFMLNQADRFSIHELVESSSLRLQYLTMGPSRR